ncbi:MAG: hypothetical protein K9I85_01240 [Saprospiraceae bacterium]|nr:hypothetical protein [Saprospiraceae bacterium]
MDFVWKMFRADGANKSSRVRAITFLLLQLAGLSWVSYQYEIEPSLLIPDLILVASIGFLVHALLPSSFKPLFFLLFSLAGLVYFVGFEDAALGLGYTLILFLAAREIPLRWMRNATVAAIVAIPIAMIVVGSSWVDDHFKAFSLFGSMTIYRLLIFMYDKQHQKESPTFSKDLSYFFMLPNMALMLFPAVDYTHWLKSYYNDRDILIYKKGVQWMVLGVFHLMVYRAIYFYMVLPIAEVTDLQSFFWHTTSNYVLILRLSGIFHLGVGTLCLFGFNMAPVFNNYFLATGFSDLWRRLNIYFRDFLVKVFYYPIFFKIRKLGTKRATFLTILIMFMISWMLHSYQWFWFKGDFPLKMVDAIFWNTWGILVATTAFSGGGARRNEEPKPWTEAAIMVAQIIGTLLLMSFMWSIWSVNELSQWLVPIRAALASPANQFLTVIASILGLWSVGTLLARLIKAYQLDEWINPPAPSGMASFWSLSMLGLLMLLQIPTLTDQVGQSLDIDTGGFLKAKLSAQDEEIQVEGYYTDLLFQTNLTSPLANMDEKGRAQFQNTEGAIQLFGYRNIVMRPNASFLFKDKQFSINDWGFRDKNYSLLPDSNTIRTLFLGGSFVAGSGVADNEVMDVLLEERMNSASTSQKYEFLNFGCPSYDLIDCVVQFEEDNLAKFKPQYLVFFSQGKDLAKNARDVAGCVMKNKPIPYPFLKRIVEKSGIKPDMSVQELLQRMAPYEQEILDSTYHYLNQICVARNITPIWVFWPTPNIQASSIAEKNIVKEIAEKNGFQILDLESINQPYKTSEISISNEDIHPNEKSHHMIADTLFHYFTKEFPLKYKQSDLQKVGQK